MQCIKCKEEERRRMKLWRARKLNHAYRIESVGRGDKEIAFVDRSDNAEMIQAAPSLLGACTHARWIIRYILHKHHEALLQGDVNALQEAVRNIELAVAYAGKTPILEQSQGLKDLKNNS